MEHTRNLNRLQRFYGAVASDQNRAIFRRVTGERVLELGCGYGRFVQEARDRGKEAFGLDIDFETLEMGRKTYPSLLTNLVQGDMKALPFKDKSLPTVILRESLHHVSWEKVLPEILRICKKELIIFEPNPNWLLRFCRKIISHQDQEIPLRILLNQLKVHGILVNDIHYRDLLAFPLSGGFVGLEFVPAVKILFPLWLWIDKWFQTLFHALRIERAISWRYLVKGLLEESEDR